METYKELYLSPDGCDTGDGSEKCPFATLERAMEEISKTGGNIRVNLAEGEYPIKETMLFTPENSGDRKIVFEGKNSTVFGGVHVSGWEKHNDKIYKAKLDVSEARNLYVNTFPASRAKSKYKYLITSLEYKDDVAVGFRVGEKNFPKSFGNWRDMEVVNPYEWECHRYRITDYKHFPETHEYLFELDTSYNTMKRLGKDTYCFYLENDLSFVTRKGDFYYDRQDKTIYYYPYDEEDMQTADTYVGCKEMFVHILGNGDKKAGNVTFKGIRFVGGACNALTARGYRCYQSDAIDNKVPELSAATPENGYFGLNTSQFRMHYAENVEFKDCEFLNMGSSIIAMNDSVSNVLIEGNIFRDSSAGAIRIGNGYHKNPVEGVDVCSDITVKNNVITRVSGELYNNCAISVYYEKNIKILNNVVSDMPYSGITLGWGWEFAVGYDCRNIEVAHNRIERVMSILHDGGSVYTLGEIKNGSIHDNYFVDSGDRGLYNDAGSACINSYNNVILGCKLFIQVQELRYGTNNIKVYNNFSDCSRILGPQKSDTIDVQPPIAVSRDNLPDEAMAIVEAAGLTEEYRQLWDRARIPEWHRLRTREKTSKEFYSKSAKLIREMRGEIEAEDYMQGGEGVAFHKTFLPMKNNNGYRPEEVQLTYSNQMLSYAVHMDEAGEWLAYEWNCPKTDDYYIEMTVGHAKAEKTLVNWYIDGELLADDVPAEYDSKFYNITAGPYHIEKGEHILKMEFVVPFYFDKFRLYTGKEQPIPEELYYTTDDDYDE